MVKKLTNMTTIYETYLERERKFEDKHRPEIGSTRHDWFQYELYKDFLRQSFIAMVEGQRQYWIDIFDSKPERTREYPCDNCTQNIARIEISRLESELIKLKEN